MFSAGSIVSRPRTPQSNQPAGISSSFSVTGGTGMSDADIAVRDQSQGMGNPYGIAGQQGPAINLGNAARAIRGNEPPVIVQIERRIDPQYSNQGLGGSPHQRQEQIPGRENEAWMLELNRFKLPGRDSSKDPEAIAREGRGSSRLAGGQTEGVGMQNTTRSSQALDESPAPTRIPHVWNDGLNAAAGIAQYAFTQQNYRTFFKHPWLGRVRYPTRGIRAVSGVTAQQSTASVVRIPAVFVPSAVG